MTKEAMDIEALRKKFQPPKIRLLLIGESPPANGDFFYKKSAMTAHTASAFKKAHGPDAFGESQAEFLDYFKACGCYLDDICHLPIDKLEDTIREQTLTENVQCLASRLDKYRPDVIAIMLKKIDKHVLAAVELADIKPKVYTLPFAGQGHQNKYIDRMAEIVKTHVSK